MTAIPYIAPWAADFKRSTTLRAPMALANAFEAHAVVPDGVWWRVVSTFLLAQAGAVAGNRKLLFTITTNPGGVAYSLQTSTSFAANKVGTCVLLPNLSLGGSVDDNGNMYATMPIPDVLWPAKTDFAAQLNDAGAGDQLQGNCNLYVELYAVDTTTGQAVPVAAPPLLV